MTDPTRYPWFKLYAADELDRISGLSLEAAGLYYRALLRCWRDGGLPTEIGALATALRARRTVVERCWPVIATHFEVGEDGRFVATFLEEQRRNVAEISSKRSEAAKSRHRKSLSEQGEWPASAEQVQSKCTGSEQNRTEQSRTEPQAPPLAPPAENDGGSGGSGGLPDWDLAELTDLARAHVQAFSRGHQRPWAFRSGLRSLGPGGVDECCTWDELSTALVRYAGSEIQGPPGVPILKRFVVDVRRRPEGAEGLAGDATEAAALLRQVRAREGVTEFSALLKQVRAREGASAPHKSRPSLREITE